MLAYAHSFMLCAVTETDQQCEALIIGLIKNQYPDHVFIAEEVRP